jgi:hypothetical protein
MRVVAYSAARLLKASAIIQQFVTGLQCVEPKPQEVRLAVSPSPLASTHTAEDVAVKNFYSKSVLRMAAEEIAAENERVDYLPAYESFISTTKYT